MFGTLLGSRARRHRRTGGAALSIAAHVAIIGVTTAATMHRAPAPPPLAVKPEFVVFKATPAPKPPGTNEHGSPTSSRTVVLAPITLVDLSPTMVPPSLPDIDLSSGVTPDLVSIGRQPSGPAGGGAGRTFGL